MQSGASLQAAEGPDNEQVSYRCQKTVLPEGCEFTTTIISILKLIQKDSRTKFLGGVMFI